MTEQSVTDALAKRVPLADLAEAAIWRCLQQHRVTVPNAGPFIDDLLAVFDAYAVGDSERLTAARREALARDGWRWQGPRSAEVQP